MKNVPYKCFTTHTYHSQALAHTNYRCFFRCWFCVSLPNWSLLLVRMSLVFAFCRLYVGCAPALDAAEDLKFTSSGKPTVAVVVDPCVPSTLTPTDLHIDMWTPNALALLINLYICKSMNATQWVHTHFQRIEPKGFHGFRAWQVWEWALPTGLEAISLEARPDIDVVHKVTEVKELRSMSDTRSTIHGFFLIIPVRIVC